MMIPPAFDYSHTDCGSGALAPLLMWAAAEDGLTLVAASIAMLRPLLKAVFPGSSVGGSYDREGSYAMKATRINGARFVPAHSYGPSGGGQSYEGRDFDVDDKSDTSILNDAAWEGSHIRKATEVRVFPDHRR